MYGTAIGYLKRKILRNVILVKTVFLPNGAWIFLVLSIVNFVMKSLIVLDVIISYFLKIVSTVAIHIFCLRVLIVRTVFDV